MTDDDKQATTPSPIASVRRVLTPDHVAGRLSGRSYGRRGFPTMTSGLSAPATLGDHILTPGALPPSRPLTPAAVLVPLVLNAHGLSVLLTQRTDHLHDHAGQISFPGGRIEEHDTDELAAALRETEEEIGLPRDYVEVIGRLDTWITGTGFEVSPVVGFVRTPYPVTPDPFEVADVFEVPLDFIADPANRRLETRETKIGRRSFYVMPYENRYIWGATAGMLVNLAEILSD